MLRCNLIREELFNLFALLFGFAKRRCEKKVELCDAVGDEIHISIKCIDCV